MIDYFIVYLVIGVLWTAFLLWTPPRFRYGFTAQVLFTVFWPWVVVFFLHEVVLEVQAKRSERKR